MTNRTNSYSEVYYSNFWYSRFYRQSLIDFDGNIVKNEVEFHRFRLRLLAIFFERIYIPRTHLLTFRDRIQGQINGSVFSDPIFGYLLENDRLAVSSLPGLDASQDSERIISRSGETDRVVYPDDSDYVRSIPITPAYEIDSKGESAKNTITFPEYGRRLSLLRPKLSEIFLDIASKSSIKEAPFFHEDFLSRLSDEIEDKSEFEMIWRDTNSIYLTTGFVHNQCIAYFNDDIERVNFRWEPENVDRYLFNPNTLYTFLGLHFTDDELQKLLYGDVEKVMWFLRPGRANSTLLGDFQRDYQRLAKRIAEVTRGTELSQNLNQSVMRTVIDLAQNGQFRKNSKALQSLMDDVSKLSRLGDLDGVVATSLLINSAARHGQIWWQAIGLKRRYPGIVTFVNAVKGQLKGA